MIKKIITNFTALFTGEAISCVCHFVSVIYIARILGAAGFGAISFSLAIVAYFLIPTNLGLSSLGVREIARKKNIKETVETVISIRLITAFLLFLAILICIFFLNKSSRTTYLIAAYALTLFPYAASLDWVFVGTERMKYNAYGRVINAAVYLTLILVFVRGIDDILKVAFAAVLTDMLTTAFYHFNYRRKFGLLRLRVDFKNWIPFLFISSQLSLSSAMIIINRNFGTVALGFMKNEETVGIYGAAAKLIFFFFTLNTVIVTTVYPVTARLYHESRDRLEAFLNNCLKVTLVLGFPLGIGGMILGPKIIKLIYNHTYASGGAVFQIMCWYAAINLTTSILGNALVSCEMQTAYLKILLAGTLFNITLTLFTIPVIGYYGPSIAVVVMEFVILIASLCAIAKIVSIPVIKMSLKPLAASIAMGLFLLGLSRISLFILMPAAMAFYFGILFMIGGLKREEILKIREAFV